jgi:UDP-glucose 4-epimerase
MGGFAKGGDMKVLVTGSAGFLGGHICRSLLDDGMEVSGFDLLATGRTDIREEIGDLLDVDEVTNAAADHDVICHIGAIGDVYLAAEQPQLAASVNVTGSANIAIAAERVGARVVYASTWEVYGDPRYEPVDEEHPCNPDHPYNITKLAGERMLLASDKLRGVPAVALRLGTAYGLGMRTNSVFEIFIRRAMNGEPITIQGDGAQGRQFTHASDIGRAFASASRSDARGMVFNIVSPEMVTIKQLAEMVVERFPTEVSFGEPRAGDVAPSYVSGERAAEILGWRPEVDFEKGMHELLGATRDVT